MIRFMLSLCAGYFVLFYILAVGSVTQSNNWCFEKGFESTTLLCNTCETLKEVLKNDHFYDDCSKCCSIEEVEKFSVITLVTDRRWLKSNNEVYDMLKTLKKTYKKAIEVKYRAFSRAERGTKRKTN